MQRGSLTWPVLIGIVMIVLIVALTVGWVILSVREALAGTQFSGLYWTLLSVGTVFLTLVLMGAIFYLAFSIQSVNLNRRQSNFIDSVTHELKSPIASLKLYLQTLNRHRVSEQQRTDFHRFMLEDVERLDQLINHLLDAARLDQEPVHSDVEDVELAPVLQKTAEAACLRYHMPREAITLELSPSIVPGRLFEIDLLFRNLIDNAVKYSGPHTEVTIESASAEDGTVVTRISDNGRGIPPKLRRKIFSRFVRLGRELERDTPGTGLGLYIVRTIVKRMHGRIHVRDRGAGPGTVFEVQLPGRSITDAAPSGRSDRLAVGG